MKYDENALARLQEWEQGQESQNERTEGHYAYARSFVGLYNPSVLFILAWASSLFGVGLFAWGFSHSSLCCLLIAPLFAWLLPGFFYVPFERWHTACFNLDEDNPVGMYLAGIVGKDTWCLMPGGLMLAILCAFSEPKQVAFWIGYFLGQIICLCFCAMCREMDIKHLEEARNHGRQELERIRKEIRAEQELRAYIEQIRSTKPTTALGFAERGRDFMEVGLLDEALVNLDGAILMDPDCAEAHLWKGMAQAAQLSKR